MVRDVVLQRVAALHLALLAVLVLVQHGFGYPTRGTLLGGGLAGFSFVTFWVVARSITEPRRKAFAILLGVLKVSFYIALSAAILGGRVVVDGLGFALGVSCFVAAALVAGLAGPAGGQVIAAAGD